ncbi:MauE/DoxX family redox-associated membrane protein [Chryseobacterium indoltheticum]|uniref:Methylamine utilisation protein MauE n=1 Tax=Chryseobacterium indoltheticum TaxID=254 RepID=A0A381FBM9_9FLAO|nr:MauE/DoxX family redox-associated membrane protein [Chryseobacterium indoltheticum]AZA73781.1 tellurium resistance protein TerC [Chryseobacterium indoltheticum]SIQ95046.1 Methylamine utilisation protein MauE [Chryseobacterium indoltheticum]SUX43991.1 Uncharacterised protein [Chryseobacterium indoltheticum]
MNTIKTRFVEIVSYFFILLFCYASISKILDFENFQIQIAQSPLLSAFADIVSYSVLIIELLVSSVLVFEKTRRLGLYCSFVLMIAFTVYIYLILNYSDFIPCSCGGILEDMDWKTHLIFNIATVILAAVAIFLQSAESKKSVQKTSLWLLVLTVVSGSSIIVLYQRSEYIIKKENNFTRRFLQHPLKQEKRLNLGFNSYYFAGTTKDSIYLGNYTTPFTLTSMDIDFKDVKELKVIPDVRSYQFKRAQFQVNGKYYYLYDGSVPVIYRGIIGQKNAQTLSYGQAYFSQLVNMDENSFSLSTFYAPRKTQSLGLLFPESHESLLIKPDLLKNHKDPVFETDGQLHYDCNNQQLVYVHYYKNEVIVMGKAMNLKATYKTIDTISQPKIDISKLSDGRRKMNHPPLAVNKKSFVQYGLLFNESNLIGRDESREMWNTSAVIDVYSTLEQKYIGSFYIPKPKEIKKIQFQVTDQYFIVLIGNEIVRYRFAQNLSQHFIKGNAENLQKE